MIHDNVLQLVLTGVFAVATAYFLVRVATAAPLAERVNSAWHALTGAAMAAMLWSWGMSAPPIFGILVFGAATLWFVFQAWSDRFGHENQRMGRYHAAMAASMVWMWTSMPHLTHDGEVHNTATAPQTPSMTRTEHAGHESVALDTPQQIDYISAGAGMLYLAAATWFILILFRALTRRSSTRTDVKSCGANILMATGMAACFLMAA